MFFCRHLIVVECLIVLYVPSEESNKQSDSEKPSFCAFIFLLLVQFYIRYIAILKFMLSTDNVSSTYSKSTHMRQKERPLLDSRLNCWDDILHVRSSYQLLNFYLVNPHGRWSHLTWGVLYQYVILDHIAFKANNPSRKTRDTCLLSTLSSSVYLNRFPLAHRHMTPISSVRNILVAVIPQTWVDSNLLLRSSLNYVTIIFTYLLRAMHFTRYHLTSNLTTLYGVSLTKRDSHLSYCKSIELLYLTWQARTHSPFMTAFCVTILEPHLTCDSTLSTDFFI